MLKPSGRLHLCVALKNLNHHHFPSRRGLLTLAIESSCDDTSVAILEKNSRTSDHKSSCLASLHFHERITANNIEKRGIDPITSLYSHGENLARLVQKSLYALPSAFRYQSSQQEQHITLSDGSLKRCPDFITVTRGPGMRSNLSCGLDTAKGLAVAWQIPMVAIHHMQAHALTPRLVHALAQNSTSTTYQPKFPFLSLLISGGHTLLIQSKSLTEHKTLATTADIAIGEALDKIGRLILPDSIQTGIKDVAYARHLSNYAFPAETDYLKSYQPPSTRRAECTRNPNEYGWAIPLPLAETRQLTFSFSGISSFIHDLFPLRSSHSSSSETERLTFARSALTVSFNHLASRTVIALEKLRHEHRQQQKREDKQSLPTRTLVVSGGVAANPFLRHVLRRFLDVRGFGEVELVFPPPELCTDNAAMVAWCGMEMFEAGWRSELSCRAVRRWSMDSEGEGGGGGVLGVEGWYNVDKAVEGEGGGGD